MSTDTDIVPPISSSICRVETVYGDHEFKITGYSLIKGLGIGKSVDSKNFSAGGYEWTIKFYPDGARVGSHVSVLVVLASDVATEVKATLDFTLMDQSGRNQHVVHKREIPCPFRKGHPSWGWYCFVEIDVLESSDYIKDDSLLIRGRVGVVVMSTEEAETYSIEVPPSNIGQQFGQFLESGEGTDIRFVVQGQIFDAHKFVLVVRSSVFKAQLLGPMKNDDTNECVVIVDMEAATFRALLHYIYWDDVADLDYLLAQHLLEAADRFGLERLQLICEAKLCECVSIDNAAITLALAEQHNRSQLKSVCLRFIARWKNLKDVMQTDGFKHLQLSCPSVVSELLHYVVAVGIPQTTNLTV